jgi:hypothetical protein
LNEVLGTANKDWGFWATMREHATEGWPIAFMSILEATRTDPLAVKTFLDSRLGRHFADDVNDRMHRGASLGDAIAKTTAEWMTGRIARRIRLEMGIPADMPFLTVLVICCGVRREII